MHRSFHTLLVVVSVSPQTGRRSTETAQLDTSFRVWAPGTHPHLTLFDTAGPNHHEGDRHLCGGLISCGEIVPVFGTVAPKQELFHRKLVRLVAGDVEVLAGETHVAAFGWQAI